MQYVWVILLFLPSALSQSGEKFVVVVPDAPVFGVSGSDVVLSCSVRELDRPNFRKNAVDMNVTWSRPDIKDPLVHFYGNHEDLNTGQNPFYRKRTTLFKEELKNGDASLKLFNVHPSDEGEYRCFVESIYWHDQLSFKLSVEVVGSEAVITMEKYESGKFSLLCESKGWYPEPELQWRNSKEVNLTAETETRAVSGLFNVKSRITVEKIDSFYCTVTQRVHVKEGRIDAQSLYEHVPSEAGKIVGITIGVLFPLGVLAGVVFYVYYRRRKRQEEIREERRKKQEVETLLNSNRDGRLKHHDLSPRQWDYVEFTLLNSEEDLKEFNLKKFDPSDRGVQKLKKVIASFKKALLEDCNLTEESCAVLASVLKSKNSLEELNLSENKLRDSGVEKLCEGLKDKNCKLEILRLEDCYLTGESCKYLAPVLQSVNSKLIELNLNKNKLKDSGVNNFCYALKDKNCKLEKLRLEDCDLTEESCEHLASVLKSWYSKLIELNLSHNKQLKDKGVNKLWNWLKKDESCKLEILRLEDCGLTQYSCIHLARVLKSVNSKLIELNLSNNRLQDLGVEKLCEGLKNEHCKLQILRLEDCGLTGESCKYWFGVLKSENSKLIELNLNNNTGLDYSGVTDEGVKNLWQGLKHENCKLKKLRLYGCGVTDEVFSVLAAALIENPSSPLEELDLSGNGLEESELKQLPELKEKLPNLKVKF